MMNGFYGGRGVYGGMMGGFGTGGGIVMGLMCLVFLALAILGIIALIKYIRSNPPVVTPAKIVPPANAKAIELLNERLAKGEVTAEEYEAIKNTLLKS